MKFLDLNIVENLIDKYFDDFDVDDDTNVDDNNVVIPVERYGDFSDILLDIARNPRIYNWGFEPIEKTEESEESEGLTEEDRFGGMLMEISALASEASEIVENNEYKEHDVAYVRSLYRLGYFYGSFILKKYFIRIKEPLDSALESIHKKRFLDAFLNKFKHEDKVHDINISEYDFFRYLVDFNLPESYYIIEQLDTSRDVKTKLKKCLNNKNAEEFSTLLVDNLVNYEKLALYALYYYIGSNVEKACKDKEVARLEYECPELDSSDADPSMLEYSRMSKEDRDNLDGIPDLPYDSLYRTLMESLYWAIWSFHKFNPVMASRANVKKVNDIIAENTALKKISDRVKNINDEKLYELDPLDYNIPVFEKLKNAYLILGQNEKDTQYILDTNLDHKDWFVTVLESKVSGNTVNDKNISRITCLTNLYMKMKEEDMFNPDVSLDLFIYRFSGYSINGPYELCPANLIQLNISNGLIGYILRCLISNKKEEALGMARTKLFFVSKTGKGMNPSYAKVINVMETASNNIPKPLTCAITLLKSCGFINVEEMYIDGERGEYKKKDM